MEAANTRSQRPDRASASEGSRRNAASAPPAAAASSVARSAARSAPVASPSRVRQFASNVLNVVTSPFRGRSVGGSPFSGSDANSPLTATTTAGDDTSEAVDIDTQIREQFIADHNERGDGGDSDEEGEEINTHHNATSFLDEVQHQQRREDNIRREEDDDDTTAEPIIPGAPDGWTPPKPPNDHSGYTAKPNSGAPTLFSDVDNPGGWCDYFFMPKYSKDGKYLNHATVGGAKVLPVDPNTGKREIDGWEFHYDAWTPGEFEKETYARGTATKDNLKPDDRKGSLCVDTLKRLGCTKERVKKDPFWFLQVLLPVCDPSSSGIENDNRMPYFTRVAGCTNMYSFTNPRGTDYGHKFNLVNETEMVRWTGVTIRNGSLNGEPGDIYKRFQRSDDLFDSPTASAMPFSRWTAIKSNFKMNVNTMNPEKGTDGYDPCAKYDYINKVVVHNMNYVTKKAEKDCAVDESTWGHSGYMAECGGRLRNKPKPKGTHQLHRIIISSIFFYSYSLLLLLLLLFVIGGQTVYVFDISKRYPRAYLHRHSVRPRPAGFTAEGHAEMYYLVDQLEDLVEGINPEASTTVKDIRNNKEVNYKKKKIYEELPHITADNHFNGDNVQNRIGEKGGGMTATLRKDRIPSKAKPFLNHLKLEASSKTQQKRARVGKFQKPITAIKKVAAVGNNKAYTRTLVSFQSTGVTNISGVNNLPSVSFYVSIKGRGQGASKRLWGIEQNEARQIYLGNYYGIDNVDHMIKIAKIRYISWKYWHSPVNHCLSIAVVAAYDMYNECCDGELDPEWAIPLEERMHFSTFRQTLAKQMLAYDPVRNLYPGDSSFRSVTRLTKEQRRSRNPLPTITEGSPFVDAFVDARRPLPGFDPPPPRLCGPLNNLQKHLSSIEKKTWTKPCEICGEKTLWRCTICDKWMCTNASKKWNGAECAVRFHNDSFFGLAKCDHKFTGLKRPWRPPTDNDVNRNVSKMQKIMKKLNK